MRSQLCPLIEKARRGWKVGGVSPLVEEGEGSTEEEGGWGFHWWRGGGLYLPSFASLEVSSVSLPGRIPSSMCQQEQSSCQRREA